MKLKKIIAAFAAFALSLSAFATEAEIRTVFENGKTKTEKAALEKLADGSERLVIARGKIAPGVKFIDVIHPLARVDAGTDGWWAAGRGVYGKFAKREGFYSRGKSRLPIFAVSTPRSTFWAHIKTFRFNYSFCVSAKGGKYEIYPRFRIAEVRRNFDLYDVIVVEFNPLSGGEATYAGVARAYRKYKLDRGDVVPIKERMKKYPALEYLCDSIVVRIQTHAAKPIPDKPVDFTKETEQPLAVHFPFGVSEEFVKAIKDSGVDKCTIVSAGWNTGGYDGRTPAHFPVEEAVGGEAGLRSLAEKTKALGFQFTLHATNTDAYTVSPQWSPDIIGKNRDGSLVGGYTWAGGRCFLVCQKASWNSYVPGELRQMRALGAEGPHYIDVYSATYPNYCADPKHHATPEEMAVYQNKILAMSKELFGGAASEGGFDHVAGNIDYINYVGRDIKDIRGGSNNKLVDGVFPIWEIVYHGIILYNSDRATQNHTRGKCLYKLEKSGDPRWMEGDGIVDPYISLKIVEFGGRPVFYTYKFADVPRIKRAWDEFVPVRHLQKELIDDHREIAPGVFMTAYADGSKTVCNYRSEPFKWRGEKIRLFSPESKRGEGRLRASPRRMGLTPLSERLFF